MSLADARADGSKSDGEAGADGRERRDPHSAILRRVRGLLRGSWVVISGVISRVTIVIANIKGPMNLQVRFKARGAGFMGLRALGLQGFRVSGASALSV